MKKRTFSKLKSIFSSKKGKRHHQESSKSSRSPSPEAAVESPVEDTFRPILRTPPPSRAGPPPSPPVPTHPVAPVPPEPAGPQPLSPCQVCGRTFLPRSLAKHVKICEKMAAKKRKTFDSSRQRREGMTASHGVDGGTDLEQFLPKNFGLPENSPFLEKSPPNTAKPAPKPCKPTVKTLMSNKATSDLQRCPHCNRAFGSRAFDRHVEWCADKAKILPAAPAQPPPHIADAKQRLNARTQYKAPLARGRRSSQSRDKSNNSRSASVDSSRGASPPPPREYGDYNRSGRLRASESMSSNDHEESVHVPVIKHSRNSNTSGDTSVKARQARLARDLSSSRISQDSPVEQSTTDPDIKKSSTKPTIRLNVKKQQQLKKLEEIANKYSERQEKLKEEIVQQNRAKEKKMILEKSLIPIPKQHTAVRRRRGNAVEEKETKVDNTSELNSPKPGTSKVNNINKKTTLKAKTATETFDRKVKNVTLKKDNVKGLKESTMSLDSLDIPLGGINGQATQSIGINTELICPCVPCVIHENFDSPKKMSPINKTKTDHVEKIISNKVTTESNSNEPKVELLFQNLSIVSSCDIQARKNEPNSFEDIQMKSDKSVSKNVSVNPIRNFNTSERKMSRNSDKNYSNLDKNVTSSDKSTSDKTDSLNDFGKNKISSDSLSEHNKISTLSTDSVSVVHQSGLNEGNKDVTKDIVSNSNRKQSEKTLSRDLTGEEYDDYYERDMSADFEDSVEDNNNGDNNRSDNITRHGSGDTYTKFTENPDDLEEFISLTDQMMSNHNFNEDNLFDMDKELDNIRTPKTSSLETMAKSSSENVTDHTGQNKLEFSDTLEDLKSNFKELLDGAGKAIDKIIKENKADSESSKTQDNEEKRQVNDMEHITVYQLKTYEQRNVEEIQTKQDAKYEFRLPDISENNKPERKGSCGKKRMQSIFKSNRQYKLLTDHSKTNKEYTTFIKDNQDDNSDGQSITAEAPPLKLPRIENTRFDENYDPFASAARQMKELMSSETNIPKKFENSHKDPNRTLPILRPAKEKSSLSYLRSDNSKSIKDSLNKTYQKTPTLQRMKSFGSTNNDSNTNTFGGRCSSFRINRTGKQSSQTKLNTTFTKSSKENLSTTEKSMFNRNSNLNRSFSSYNATAYSTPKPKDKIPKISTSMYHSFQRTTIKQPVKLDRIKKDDNKKDFVNLDAILADDNSSMTDSNYIDPRLINENDNLPINVNTILNNPDIISSMESLLTSENLPKKFDSFHTNVENNNNNNNNQNSIKEKQNSIDSRVETNNNINIKVSAPIIVDELSVQYDKIMSSLEQSIASKTSIRDDDSLCGDFDLEEFMTSFDEEIHKHKETKRTCSSTTRVVKTSDFIDSNRTSELNSISSSPKLVNSGSNGLIPVNKSNSLTFSSNNVVSDCLFPSSVKRSTSLLDSIQKKNAPRADSGKTRHKSDQLEQDIMQSLKEFDKLYDADRNDINQLNAETKYKPADYNGTAKRESRVKSEKKSKKNENDSNGNFTPNGKSADSAYSSLNRISPSKLSVCNSKDSNGSKELDNIPAGSDSSGCQKDELRSVSSDEFLAMERSAENDEPLPAVETHTVENTINEKCVSSRPSSRRSTAWRVRALSSSGSEASLHRAERGERAGSRRESAVPPPPPPPPAPRLSRFCHECGSKFPVETAKFCIECGVKRLVV